MINWIKSISWGSNLTRVELDQHLIQQEPNAGCRCHFLKMSLHYCLHFCLSTWFRSWQCSIFCACFKPAAFVRTNGGLLWYPGCWTWARCLRMTPDLGLLLLSLVTCKTRWTWYFDWLIQAILILLVKNYSMQSHSNYNEACGRYVDIQYELKCIHMTRVKRS